MKTPTLSLYHSSAARRTVLVASVASLISVVTIASSHAGAVVFGGTPVTETFDTLGTTGTDTTLLTGAGSFPNDGSSPWTAGIVGSGTGGTAATVTTTTLHAVSDGSVAVANPEPRLFNNGETPDTDRALGSANTAGDPVFDLQIKNSSGSALSAFSISYDTEFWRGANGVAPSFGYLLYFSETGADASWVNTGAVQPSKTYALQEDLDGNDPANRVTIAANFTLPAPIANDGTFFLRWRDSNDATNSPDANIAIDNVVFNAIAPGKTIIWNRSHTVGGAPNGDWDLSQRPFWKQGATPVGFSNGDIANFSEDGDTVVNVKENVAPFQMNVTHAAGTYTIGGVGKISGAFTKSNAGALVLTSENEFSSATITAGTVETQKSKALGAVGVSISGGALWKVTTEAQTQNGPLAIGAGDATIQTDTDLTAGVIDGAGKLSKTGNGTLFLTTEPGTGSGGLDILAGKVSTAQPGGLGNNQKVTLHATTLEFTNAGDRTFSDATRLRTIDVGAQGGTIGITAPGALIPGTVGITVNNADSITGSGTITKTGDGVLRMRAEHTGLTSNWVINGGTLEYSTSAGANLAVLTNAIGSGTVTVNTGGRFGLQGGVDAATPTVATNNITLNGGALGVRTNDFSEFSGTVNVAAPSAVDLFSFTTPDNAVTAKLSGVLSGSANLTLNGPATATAATGKALLLTNSGNTYTGAMTVGAGAGLAGTGRTLGSVSVNAFGLLGAGSDVAAATFGAGVLSIGGNLTLAPEAVFIADLAGGDPSPVAGTNYDRIVVGTGPGASSTGQISLNGSRLGLTLGTGIETNDLFFIMTNDGVDPVIGTFADYVDNQEFTDPTSGQIFRISYNADEASNAFDSVTGNDIALIAVPEPGSAALLAVGSALLLRRRRRD